MFVELPIEEAYAPLYASLKRLAFVLLAALALRVPRRPVSGAHDGRCRSRRCAPARRGSAAATSRSASRSRPATSSKALADQFNDMAGRLQESYAGLEQKVEHAHRASWRSRSASCARSARSPRRSTRRSTSRPCSPPSSPRRSQLSDTEAGAIYVFETGTQEFRLRATYGMSGELIAAHAAARHAGLDDAVIGDAVRRRAARSRSPICARSRRAPINEIMLRAGYRALLDRAAAAPRRGRRRAGGPAQGSPASFRSDTVDLLQTFAAQSVLAIQNAQAVRARSRKRAGSSRSRASTSRSSSPT